ncbi:MAG TPA: FAD-dependent oxidoreductase [Candidatus Sumerlaeota bacterium]|nr:FAD-dependent oxidoreductase [Candidatus Sumerlaeota bacterium]HPK03391.1 FAD-dependent oxidoreductase [Candidatus Sumerlaeota bacterium]
MQASRNLSTSPGSCWRREPRALPVCPPAAGELETDVVILGAGITGLTAGLHLLERGRRVMLLEAHQVGGGATGGSTGHLTALLDTGLGRLIEDWGQHEAGLMVGANLTAISQIEQWSARFSPDCQLQRVEGILYTENAAGAGDLGREADAARLLGLGAEALDRVPLPFPCHAGYRITGQARFDPLRYVLGLARRFLEAGGVIHEQSPAKPPQDGGGAQIETPAARIQAGDVIVATHLPYVGALTLETRNYPQQSYVLLVRLTSPLHDALFWDDAEPYHYIRRYGGDDPHLVLIGGADHRTGLPINELDHLAQLEQYARARFAVEAVEGRWSDEFVEPADGAPFAGRLVGADHIWIATGYAGNGLTWGTACGLLLADLLTNEPNPLAGLLDPRRVKGLAALDRFVPENLRTALEYARIPFEGERVDSLAEVGPGEGRLVRYQGRKLAVWRDPGGELTILSPVCRHLGCIVKWNEAAATWDCPCHGGRYTATGERLGGPPPDDLEPAALE